MESTVGIPSVTGVDVTLRVAGPGGRSYAFVIDWHIRVLAALAWYLVAMLAFVGGLDPEDLQTLTSPAFTFVGTLPSLAIYFLYHPVLEILMQGRTPGKRIAGLRLLKRDGSVPGIGALLIRNVFRLVDSLPIAYCVGLVTTMLTRHAVRIGDMAAGTILVYDDASDTVLSELSSAAIDRLGLERAELVRDLLARWTELDPPVRDALGREMLETLGQPTDASGETLRSALREQLK
jgi:uncharacterized RDD family membrane protein YckC